MNKSLLYIVSAAFMLSTMTGCSLFKTTTTTTPSTTESSSIKPTTPAREVDQTEINGEWTISSVAGKKVTGETRPYITFNDADGRIYGSNGCNYINGDFKAGPHASLAITNVVSTMMACPNAPFETAINHALDKATSYKITREGHEYYMSLLDAQGSTLMELRKHNMEFLNGTWMVTSINGKANNNIDVEMVIDIAELKIHGNTGCNILNGAISIDPDKTRSIQFQNLATTRMRCSDEAMSTETALLVALESVESARQAKNNTVFMADKNGRTVLTLKKVVVE